MLTLDLNKTVQSSISKNWLTQIAGCFAKEYKLKDKYYFSLAFVDSQTIKHLNQIYRKKNKITDILSFAEEKDDFIAGPAEKNNLGEILICISQAKKQAKELGHSLKTEMARLLIHGLAHLVGYEHEGVTKKKEKEMIEFETRVMEKINFKV